MSTGALIRRTPWDSEALGLDAYELLEASPAAMAQAGAPGHYTVKVDTLCDKRLLHENGFYYCDTLLQPHCAVAEIRQAHHPEAGIDRAPELEPLLAACRGAFRHGRFHRDFNVEIRRADARYENWLKALHAAGRVYGLTWSGEVAGFIAHEGGALVLHALGERHRGRGLARYLWSAVCADLAAQGVREITSSISAGNTAALSLYASLGFRFRRPLDVYHRVIR